MRQNTAFKDRVKKVSGVLPTDLVCDKNISQLL